jgi:spermidine synthase
MTTPLFEILADAETPLGPLTLRRRELLSRPSIIVTEVTLDGEHLMSSYITASERALSTLALGWHEGTGLEVLVGGLGLGYTTAEALASDRVAQVETVEFLPAVMGWCREGLIPLAATLNDEARHTLVQGDIYGRLAAEPDRQYDLILIDVDHAPDAPLDPAGGVFYTESGLQAAKRHLAPDGILGVWSSAESPSFEAALNAVFSDVRVERVEVVNELIDETYFDPVFLARDR